MLQGYEVQTVVAFNRIMFGANWGSSGIVPSGKTLEDGAVSTGWYLNISFGPFSISLSPSYEKHLEVAEKAGYDMSRERNRLRETQELKKMSGTR